MAGTQNGLSEDKVRDALRFTDLSPQIMQWFNEGIINYAVAVECWRLREAALSYYSQKYPHKYEAGSGKLNRNICQPSETDNVIKARAIKRFTNLV